MISVFIILILLIILLIIFVSRVTELVIAKIQQNMQPALQKNLEQESVNPIHQPSP